MSDLIVKIKNFPKSPGVYQFIDKSGVILYVGKAKNLKDRIKSYFAKEIGRGPGIEIMVANAVEAKFIVTDSEIEAVLLEAELIKKVKPKYNIRLRDDKSFLVIKITKPKNMRSILAEPFLAVISTPQELRVEKSSNKRSLGFARDDKKDARDDIIEKKYHEFFSCVELVRSKNVDLSDKSAWYFGPYPAGELLKKSLRFLRKIFPYRDCSITKFKTYRRKGRPCIYGDIRVCTAPCVDWVNEEQYKKNIVYLMEFLRGRKDIVYRKLRHEMEALSKSKRFEEASLIRDRLGALDHLKDIAIGIRDDVFNGSHAIFKKIECYDVSNISGQYGVGAMVVFQEGKKNTDDYRKFKIKFSEGANDVLMMKEMLERRLKNDWVLPDLIVIDGGEAQLKIATEVLKHNKLKIPIISIAKGAKRDKNELHFGDDSIAKYFKGNLYLQNIVIAARDEAHRFAISYYRLLHKKGMFK